MSSALVAPWDDPAADWDEARQGEHVGRLDAATGQPMDAAAYQPDDYGVAYRGGYEDVRDGVTEEWAA